MIRRKPLKRLLLGLMALAMILAYFPAFAWNTYADDVVEPTEIEKAGDLMQFVATVNGGQTDLVGVLKADIDLTSLDYIWPGIGTEENPFTGEFHGEGHTIKGLQGKQGLFGHVKDVVIDKVSVYGTVTAEEAADDAAGIVGCVEESSEGAYTYIGKVGNYVTVTSTGTNVGGIVGHVATGAKAEVCFSFNKAAVTGLDYAGGIVGRNEGTLTVESCYNAGSVEATFTVSRTSPDSYAGGICATPCTINDSYNTGNVLGHHRSSGGRIRERGYALTSGTPVYETVYWLEESAAYATARETVPASTGEAAFTSGLVLAGLNAYYEVENPWIEGAKVRVAEEAEPQRYPGLSWEIIDVDGLKALAISKLESYVDPEDYGDPQQVLLGTVIGDGKTAINNATDDASIDAALAAAEKAIDDIPNLDDIADAKSEILGYIDGNEYNESQQTEVDIVLGLANLLLDASVKQETLDTVVQSAEDALDEIPVSEEVAKADAAKLELRETMVYAKALVADGEYAKEGMIALNKAIPAAEKVYANPDAFEAEVIAANDGVWEALLSLKASNNEAKSELLSTLISAKRIDGEKFTDASIEKLEMAIAKAEEALADPDAPSGKLRQLRAEVLSAINDLVIDEDAAAAAEAAAEAKTLAEAKTYLLECIANSNYILNTGEYTKLSAQALSAVIADAALVYVDPEATYEDVAEAYEAVVAATAGLEPSNETAKAELYDVVLRANKIDKALYTAESYTILATELGIANEALEDADAPSGKLRHIKTELLKAINGLVIDEAAAAAAEAAEEAAMLAEAKSYLLETLASANSVLAAGEFTRETALSLRSAIEAATIVYNNVEATLADVIEADEAVKGAVVGLKASNETAKAELLDVLLRARKIDKAAYTAESYAILAAAIQTAEAALADPNSSAGKLRHVKTELMSAVNSLVEDQTAAAAAEAAAKAEALAAAKNLLRERMVSAKVLLMAGGCTKDSIAKLQAAMANADTVYKNLATTEAQVIEADEALRNAMLELEVSTDGAKGALLDTLIKMQSVDKTQYTSGSYKALQNAINAANKLAKDPKATIEDLNKATIDILNARNSLVKKAANPMKVTKQNKAVKFKKLLRKNQVVKVVAVKKAVGKVTFKKTSGSGRFAVNSSNGKVTIKKGTKKGSYIIKISVKAAGNGNYFAKEQVVSVKIVVK